MSDPAEKTGNQQVEERRQQLGEDFGLLAAVNNHDQRPPGRLPEQDKVDSLGRRREARERERDGLASRLGLRQPARKLLEVGMPAQLLEQIANGWMGQGLRFSISSTMPVVE